MMKKRFSVKGIIAAVMAILMLGIFGIVGSAADSFQNMGGKYGLVVPTDANLKAQKKSYSFYGDSGIMYFMRISKGRKNAKFAIEIYSDSGMVHKIRNHTSDFSAKAGNAPLSITWNFKDVKSGTYYGRCYAYYENTDGDKVIDSTTLEKFTININRVGKKEVKIASVKNTVSGTQITWKTLPTAEKYYVYRKTAGAKNWTKIATVGADTTFWIDSKANSGNRYTYTVKCYDGKYNSLYNKKGVSIVYLSAPKLNKASTSSSAGYAKISWGKVAGASGYKVYRKGGNLSDYEWTLIATVKGGKTTTFVDKKAKSTDWNYTYTVRAYGATSSSGYNKAGVDFDYIPAPKLKKAVPYDTGMRVEWALNNDNVVKYYVYRKNAGSWVRIGETRNKYFIDTNAKSDSSYTYTVKGVSSTNAGAYSSTGISAKFIATPDINDITFNKKDATVVKWSAVKGAVGYKVYRKINNAPKWTMIKTVVGATSFADTVKKESGNTYTYTIRAYDSKGRTGYYIFNGKTGTFLGTPVFTANQLFTEDGSLQIGVSWEAINGATGYNVYRRTGGSKWIFLAQGTPELSLTDTTVENGVVYDYAVRAVTDKGDISNKYNIVSAYATTIPVLDSVTVAEEGVNIKWTAAEGATGYTVYKAEKNGGEWIKAGEVTEAGVCEFTDTAPEAKENAYFYCVSAVVNTVEGAKSNKIANFVEVNATAVFNAENKSIDISWDATVDTIVSIDKAVNDEPALPLVTDLQFASDYIDAFVQEGNLYTYTVTASQEGKLSASSVVSAKFPHPPLEETVIIGLEKTETPNSASAEITWLAVEFADQYTILRAQLNGEEFGSYEEIAVVDKAEADENGLLTYTDLELDADGTYSYIIMAAATESERDSSFSAEEKITVYKQLSGVTDLTYTSAKTDEGVSVFLSWSPTELAEKYVVTRTTVATKKTVTLAELVPDSVSGYIATDFLDEAAEENVKYIYRVTAYAENRGQVYNETEFCFGTPLAYYSDYNYEKAQLQAKLGDSNLDENEKEKYVSSVYDEVKESFALIDEALSKELTEDAQLTVDEATEQLKVLNATLDENAYYTVTFVDSEGIVLIEETVVTGTLFGDIPAPVLTESSPNHAIVGWADENDKFISLEDAISDDVTLSPAREESKLLLAESAAISFTEEGYINGIASGTSVAQIKEQLLNDLAYVEICDYLGNALEDTALVGTGTTITLVSKYTDDVYETKTAVILGDITGDGQIDEDDYAEIQKASLGESELVNNKPCFFLASDIMQDGTIDLFDVDKISQMINA